jgi:hypothetical protein
VAVPVLDSFVNLKLLANPVNWLVITLVLVFVAFSLFVIGKNSGALLPTLPTFKGT